MQTNKLKFTPLRVVLRKGSPAARHLTAGAGLHAQALAPGLEPSPQNDLVFRGGKIIQNLSFANFYVAGQSAWNPADIRNIDRALAAAMSDKHLNNVMVQYFKNQPISSQLVKSEKLPGSAPPVFSQGDAEGLVQTLKSEGMLSALDLSSTVVNLLLPPATILTTDEAPTTHAAFVRRAAGKVAIPHEDEASSKNGLGGYHGSVHSTMSGIAQTIYYAVGVFSEQTAGGQVNGIPAFPEPWKSVVATFYHELNEARTDSDVEDAIRTGQQSFLGWTSAQGEECGDFPIDETNGNLSLVFQEVPLADGSGTVPVQFSIFQRGSWARRTDRRTSPVAVISSRSAS
jgi:hypothetical protein